jgi:hypothetical protein
MTSESQRTRHLRTQTAERNTPHCFPHIRRSWMVRRLTLSKRKRNALARGEF